MSGTQKKRFMRVKDINLDRRWDENHAMPQIILLRFLVRVLFRSKSIFRYELNKFVYFHDFDILSWTILRCVQYTGYRAYFVPLLQSAARRTCRTKRKSAWQHPRRIPGVGAERSRCRWHQSCHTPWSRTTTIPGGNCVRVSSILPNTSH